MRKPLLQIETINQCNAKCVFCAVPKTKTKRKPMDNALFTRIIGQAKDYGIDNIMPFLNGEPLLDPKFADRIAEINKVIPEANVSLFSNGSLLTKEKAKQLSEVDITGVNFSINSISDSARMKVMGLPLQATIDNIMYYSELCPGVKIGVSALMDTALMTADEMTDFTRFWTERRIKPNLFFNGNWAGKMRKVANVEGGCDRPETVLTVLSDGTVALCCYDLLGEVSFGNLKDTTIKEVWESDAMENYRFLNDAGRRNELKLCSTCTTG